MSTFTTAPGPDSTMHDTRRKTRTTACRATVALLFGAALQSPAHALEDFASWDNFNAAAQIAPALWQGGERSRLIEGGALHMIQRDLGSQYDNTGLYSTSWNERLQNPGAIRQLKATVTVNDFAVSGCGANTTPSTVQARLGGVFFNAGPGVPSSQVNDIGAVIRFKRDSNSPDAAGLLRVEGLVFQCSTADCNYDSVVLGSVDLGLATVGQAAVLKTEWDPAKKRFNFYRDSNPVQRVTYTASDAQTAYVPSRWIGTRVNLANCLGGPRTEGFMDAKFDNVYVNASAVAP